MRHAGRAFEEAHLEPEAALAEHVAVVGEEGDRGAGGEAEPVEEAEELADLLVDVGDRGEVAAAGAADMLGGDREGGVVGGGHEPLRVRVLLGERDRRDGRVEGRAIGVEVPVARAGDVGVVRVGEADRQAPGARVGLPGEVVELRRRLEGDLVVVVELVGDLGGAGPGDRAEVVVPPVDAAIGLLPVGGPAEVGRVDVGGQPLLEAVQLVGADEVHLAREAGRVAGAAKVVGEGGQIGGELGGVVVDPGAARQQPGHEAGAARGAERARGVGVDEAGRAFGEAGEVRGVQERGRAVGEQGAGELVNHQDQDVRAGHPAPCMYAVPDIYPKLLGSMFLNAGVRRGPGSGAALTGRAVPPADDAARRAGAVSSHQSPMASISGMSARPCAVRS